MFSGLKSNSRFKPEKVACVSWISTRERLPRAVLKSSAQQEGYNHETSHNHIVEAPRRFF